MKCIPVEHLVEVGVMGAAQQSGGGVVQQVEHVHLAVHDSHSRIEGGILHDTEGKDEAGLRAVIWRHV